MHAMIEARRIDPKRVDRAIRELKARPLGGGRYEVFGGSEPHWVNLTASDAAGRCDCADHLWKGVVCKHMIAALIAEKHAAVFPLALERYVLISKGAN